MSQLLAVFSFIFFAFSNTVILTGKSHGGSPLNRAIEKKQYFSVEKSANLLKLGINEETIDHKMSESCLKERVK